MQTLRKKTSPLKYKNETTKFLGDGVSFKAKLIGILEVSEARGDRMCQEALSDLKMAIRAAGEHKQRITINIAIDGLRLRDEKTGDSLYHHPVHKISFIAQDMTDSRAFGYIFGSPDTGHRFFGIKTDKAASQVVIAMRDLFQVVFALKKKEIELAKSRYATSPLFSDSISSSTRSITQETTKTSTSEIKASSSEAKSGGGAGTAVADLVDLELELNSLQQGLNQMERITPSDPFGSKDDPFGDSFTSYTKPILPPPPSSGRERSNRISETSSIFSPKTPHTASLDATSADLIGSSTSINRCNKKDFSFSQDFSSSREEPSSGDWFTPNNSIFEEPPLVPDPALSSTLGATATISTGATAITKDEKHELAKQEIMSQFDVFTELDPLGTGRSKPYIDKKHFFQELKNPPKKVLKDLVSQSQQQQQQSHDPPSLFNNTATFPSALPTATAPTPTPLVVAAAAAATTTTTKLSGSDFAATEDPFGEDPFVTNDPFAEADFSKQDPFETEFNNSCNNLSKSPKTFNISFEKFDTKFRQMHENVSLDISSESECAPEPPPRPTNTLMQIKPPPLPPKKQLDISMKPPPRPPHVEDTHPLYEYIYETADKNLDLIKNTSIEKSPPIPVPARKTKFNSSDYSTTTALPPERPRKQFNVSSSEEDYLTPISFTANTITSAPEKKTILLPPPQKSKKHQQQQPQPQQQVTVASYLESKPNLTTTAADTTNLEGLDITLSQLTLSGLNELATKLNIPANQLSNMTLVQLTNYLSNFIKSKSKSSTSPIKTTDLNNYNDEQASFKADFAANFNNFSTSTTATTTSTAASYDRYAVFRELIQEEIKQTKIDTEPEELKEEQEKLAATTTTETNINNVTPTKPLDSDAADKYAALREIVETELKMSSSSNGQKEEEEEEDPKDNLNEQDQVQEQNIINEDPKFINIENKFIVEEKKYNIIDYNNTAIEKESSPKSGKSPVNVPNDERNTRINSGSLSDVISGSSPEIDNTASNSELSTKKLADAAGETWAIFDQAQPAQEIIKEKQTIQSEEGVSPWSSDSKEFGNGSPPDWRRSGDSNNDRWPKRRSKREEGWWDTSAEPEAQYYPTSNRRSTDSYEEEYYECYERPRRRKQTGYSHGTQATGVGGHSSSSRDVSPWEEEPRRRDRQGWNRHPRQHSFEKLRDRRHTDSWDEEDDYEYEEEHVVRFHRHGSAGRDHDQWDDDWNEDRRHRRRREGDRERWCCPDWEESEHEKPRYSSRWSSSEAPSSGVWRDRKHDDRYFNRESQESPWEDDYSNEADEVHQQPHYLSAKRNWKRPSSASEMDRKTGEIKSRHYLGTGGSDGERDRRYKPGRRSRSRDSQYSETSSHRHKPESINPPRNTHRNRPYQPSHLKSQFENDYTQVPPTKKPSDSSIKSMEHSNKKSLTLSRRKTKDSPKSEENVVSTFPRKSTSRTKCLFENDFVPSEEPVGHHRLGAKFNSENDFETSEAESPTVVKPLKTMRQQSMFDKTELTEFSKDSFRTRSLKESRLSPRFHLQNTPTAATVKSKSLFEDDFSPSEKPESLPEDNIISSIKEEMDPNEEDDSFSTNNFESATNCRKKKFNKHRLSNNNDVNLKKSESVNIFARESDPFDDDFFSEAQGGIEGKGEAQQQAHRSTDLKWNDDFDDFHLKDTK